MDSQCGQLPCGADMNHAFPVILYTPFVIPAKAGIQVDSKTRYFRFKKVLRRRLDFVLHALCNTLDTVFGALDSRLRGRPKTRNMFLFLN